MDYAKKILKEILTEEARVVDVTDAIKKKYEARIYYNSDDDPKGSGERIIQPVAYGQTKAGNLVIRAFQPFGDTKTKVPHWKLFRLDRIEKWQSLRNRHFTEPPAKQWGAEGAFNPSGDKSMAEVFLIADFNQTKMKNSALMDYNKKKHDERVAKDPLYDFKQNAKRAIMATPEIMRRIKWSEQDRQKASAKEMASIKDFGDKGFTQTSEPIKKNDTQNIQQNNDEQDINYNTVEKNGPIYKNNNQQ